MKHRLLFLFFLLSSAAAFVPPFETRALTKNARGYMNGDTKSGARQISQEKKARTPAQRKIDSQLLYALYRKRGEAEAKGVPTGDLRVKFDEKGRALVTIRARVTRAILAKIKSLGGEVVSSSERYSDILAHMPLEKLEELAALKDVRAIMPADEAMTNQ